MEIPTNNPEFKDLSLYERILNSPLFDVPDEIGVPDEKFKPYPLKDGLGTEAMRFKAPGSDQKNGGYDNVDPREEPLSMPDAFIYNRGLPDDPNQTMLDDPSGSVKQKVPEGFHSPSIAKEASMEDPKLTKAAEQMAETIVDKVLRKFFKSVEEAYIKLYPYIKGYAQATEGFTQAAIEWTLGLVSSLNSDEKEKLEIKARSQYEKTNLERKEVSDKMANTEKADHMGKPLGNVDKGPNQEEGIPSKMPGGRANEDDYSAPGDKESNKVPDTKNPSMKQNDELTFPKDGTHNEFHSHPAPKEKGVPDSKTPAYQENDKETFPAEAGDLNLKVTPGRQSPETERHQPYFKYPGPNSPWERKSQVKKSDRSADEFPVDPTPGMEFIYKSEDEHVSSLEVNAQEAELFYKRYLKHGQESDLQQQANRFKAERITMSLIAHCGVCDEDNKTYSSALFAYSFSQMKHSIHRAMKQFQSKDAEPNMEQYHSMTSLKADLMGSETQQYLTNAAAKAEIQFANHYATDDDKDSDEGEGCEDAASKNVNKDNNGGEKEMKAEDVRKATEVATGLLKANLIKEEALADTISELAENPSSLATMAKLLKNAPSDGQRNESSNNSKEQIDASVMVARRNMVGTGHIEKAGDDVQKAGKQKQLGSIMGIFSRAKSPVGL